jgi:hypothetical protein
MKSKVEPGPDLAAQAKRLREQTCALLGLDPNALTLAQRLRVNRASALRLQIDDLEAAQLRGQPIDINKLVDASESLERLVGGNPEAPATPDFAGAKEELENFLIRRAGALEARERTEITRLLEENARLREENARLAAQLRAQPPQPTPAPPQRPDNVVPIDATARARADERAADERAWRNYTYGGSGGVLIAPGVNIDPRR